MSTLNKLSDLFDSTDLDALKENDPYKFLTGKTSDQLDADAQKIFNDLGITDQAIAEYRDINDKPFPGTNINEKRISALRSLAYSISTDPAPKKIETMKPRTLEALREAAEKMVSIMEPCATKTFHEAIEHLMLAYNSCTS